MEFRKTKIALSLVLTFGSINVSINNSGYIEDDNDFNFLPDVFSNKHSWGFNSISASNDNCTNPNDYGCVVATASNSYRNMLLGIRDRFRELDEYIDVYKRGMNEVNQFLK